MSQKKKIGLKAVLKVMLKVVLRLHYDKRQISHLTSKYLLVLTYSFICRTNIVNRIELADYKLLIYHQQRLWIY